MAATVIVGFALPVKRRESRPLPDGRPDENVLATIYPKELYPGPNVLTFVDPEGIGEIKPLLVADGNVSIDSISVSENCSDTAQVYLHVESVERRTTCRFIVADCSKRRQIFALTLKNWTLQHFPFPDVHAGDSICRDFRINNGGVNDGGDQRIDSITCSNPNVSLHLKNQTPFTIEAGTEYLYDVCYVTDQPGTYVFSVVTWMRRKQPNGGYENFQLGDTGSITVLPSKLPSNSSVAPSTGD